MEVPVISPTVSSTGKQVGETMERSSMAMP